MEQGSLASGPSSSESVSDSSMIVMPLTPREPILLHGQIFKIWRKDAQCRADRKSHRPAAPELRYGETGRLQWGDHAGKFEQISDAEVASGRGGKDGLPVGFSDQIRVAVRL